MRRSKKVLIPWNRVLPFILIALIGLPVLIQFIFPQKYESTPINPESGSETAPKSHSPQLLSQTSTKNLPRNNEESKKRDRIAMPEAILIRQFGAVDDFGGRDVVDFYQSLENQDEQYSSHIDFRLRKFYAYSVHGRSEQARKDLEDEFEEMLEISSEFESCKLAYLTKKLELEDEQLSRVSKKCLSAPNLGGDELEFQVELANILSEHFVTNCGDSCIREIAVGIKY